ncbi:hypothetical protein Mal15_18510 [Stieleria maiorica]|uniref:Secreted protein n=1 Tax=Stieleria maiorica TaxID=2795974 RepID=A0A5B9MC67_9BACT|nr:hypothetical protein [Stieleria maiorica]QEF97806.1 hypothetical protein Mal15_18510 [Stieleria maiorica]
MRSSPLTLFLLSLCLAAGCGSQGAPSPAPGELDRYLQENPEAAARGGQEEPAGFAGPTDAPG